MHEEIAENEKAIGRARPPLGELAARSEAADERVDATEQGGPDGRVDALARAIAVAASRNAWSPTPGNIPNDQAEDLSMPPPASFGISSR